MAIELNHTVVAARDAETSARWFAEVFGLPAPTRLWHFWQVETANGVGLDFSTASGTIVGQHYAFLVSDEEWDAIFGRIVEQGIDHWADPGHTRPDEINRADGGRGVYFSSPEGHNLEIITRPYGSGS